MTAVAESMKLRIQGWKYALLFVLLFGLNGGLCGCAGRGQVYTAGVREQETQDVRSEAGELSGRNDNSADIEADSLNVGMEAANVKPVNAGAEATEPDKPAGSEPVSETEGYVYVCGAVNAPGVYPMREGMRVFEAISLAGGFAPEADCEWLNQAEPVRDGQRLYVYTQKETRAIAESRQAAGQEGSVLWEENAGAADSGVGNGENGALTAENGVGMVGDSGSDGAGSDGQRVNLNTADREQLKTLPGIGDAKADAILRYREEHGAFSSIEEIQNISGIKSGVFSKIKDLITV